MWLFPHENGGELGEAYSSPCSAARKDTWGLLPCFMQNLPGLQKRVARDCSVPASRKQPPLNVVVRAEAEETHRSATVTALRLPPLPVCAFLWLTMRLLHPANCLSLLLNVRALIFTRGRGDLACIRLAQEGTCPPLQQNKALLVS